MPKAHFVKINNATSWSDILSSIQQQVENSKKKLEYIPIKNLLLSKKEFESLISTISKPQPLLACLAHESIADENGIWHCITIKCMLDIHNIIIFTAGKTIPLYVAINKGSKNVNL